jgi:uncharacterized protein
VRAAPLRVALFLAGYALILFVASIPKGMVPRGFADLVWGVVSALATLVLTIVLLTRERRTRRDVGLMADARTAARLVAGLAIGTGVYAITAAVVSLLLGPVRWSAATPQPLTTWLLVVASCLALSAMEELGFRGYALRTLIRAIGVWPAQLAIAVTFGLMHLAFGWSVPTVLTGVIPSALLFGVLAVRTGGLAMPIGVHAALNVAQWVVGAKDSPGVWTLSVDPARTELLTRYAPLVAMGMTLLVTLAMARWPVSLAVGGRADAHTAT